MTAKKKTKRVRRTAEDARSAILDAAEQRLMASGPMGIRLQEVAGDVGVSHPTVLHHFGSREGLLEAVIARSVESLQHDLVAAIAAGAATGEVSVPDMLERLYEVLGPGGHARLVAWLALSGHPIAAGDVGIRTVSQAAHALREARHGKQNVPPFEDTYFTVTLATLAIFAAALGGPLFVSGLDPKQRAAIGKRFRTWLAKLVDDHFEHARA